MNSIIFWPLLRVSHLILSIGQWVSLPQIIQFLIHGLEVVFSTALATARRAPGGFMCRAGKRRPNSPHFTRSLAKPTSERQHGMTRASSFPALFMCYAQQVLKKAKNLCLFILPYLSPCKSVHWMWSTSKWASLRVKIKQNLREKKSVWWMRSCFCFLQTRFTEFVRKYTLAKIKKIGDRGFAAELCCWELWANKK